MRVQLNLNKYYDGLDLSDVNEIFSSFINMKYDTEQYFKLKNDEKKDEVWESYWRICRKRLIAGATKINELMERLGKGTIFDVKEIDDTDFETLIKKYDYLMSKPEIEKPEEKKIDNSGKEPFED